jgi:hypothetical protein
LDGAIPYFCDSIFQSAFMRKLFMLAVGTVMIGLVSCDKLKELAKINVGAQSQDVEFNIPVVSGAGEQNLAGANVYLNIDSIIKATNSSVGVNNIKSARVTAVSITVLEPDSANNFAVVEACKVLLSSDTKPEQVTIAEMNGNPDEYKTTVDIPLNSSVDLAEYVKGNSYSYTLWAKTRRGTTKEVKCKATISYDLTVGLE